MGKPSENIIDVCSKLWCLVVPGLAIPNRSGHREEFNWWAEFEGTVGLSVRASQVNVTFFRSVTVYLESLIYGVRTELTKSLLQIRLNVPPHVLQD